MPTNMEKLLTVNDVAEIVQASPRTVRRWIDTGKLKPTRVGDKLIRVRREDLEEFLRGTRNAGAS